MSYSFPEIVKLDKYKLSVHGWSRGSQNTGFCIPELKILLDTQIHPKFDPENIFITHGHTDHCFSLPMRILNISTKPKIYVPMETKKFISDFIDATFRMGYCDASYKNDADLVGVTDGNILPIKNGYNMKVYDLCHNVPCRGYGLQYTRTKLKPEYTNLNKSEIIELKKKGENIVCSTIENVLAYITDTSTDVFSKQPELFTYQYIFVECTFLPINEKNVEKEIKLANEAGHTHWNLLYPIMQLHPEITFVLIHFSHRYSIDELTKFKSTVIDKNIIFAI